MFTKEDYIRYFEDLSHVERKMIYMVNGAIAQLSDPQVINSLNRVAADEAKHYSYILDLLSTHLDLKERGERRISSRTNSLGQVELTPVQAADKRGMFRGYCANLSPTGICVESIKPFQTNEEYALKVNLYESAGPVLERKGKVVWAREILDFFICGIVFET